MAKNTGRGTRLGKSDGTFLQQKSRGGAFGKRTLNDRFADWYDRQPLEVIFLIALSPMIAFVVVLTVCVLIWG